MVKSYFISCPYCDVSIEIPKRSLACKVFRCGVYKADKKTKPINPHTPEAECKRLVAEGLIYGCGGPFRFDGVTVEKCGYL